MMPYDKKITRENAPDIIKQFAKEYRKELGKVPGEIIIVGGVLCLIINFVMPLRILM